jgi:hypothetical protein
MIQPVAQTQVHVLAPEDVELLGTRDPTYRGRVGTRPLCATGWIIHALDARERPLVPLLVRIRADDFAEMGRVFGGQG